MKAYFDRKTGAYSRKWFVIIALLLSPIVMIEAAQEIYDSYCSDLSWHCPKCGYSNWKFSPPYTCGHCGHRVG